MAKITLRGTECNTSGELPQVGKTAPAISLVDQDLGTISYEDFADKKKIVSIVPSLDTPTCALSTQKFSEAAAARDDVVLLVVSADLPFAAKRFCTATNTNNAITLSTFRSSFARDYGIEIIDGPLAGVCGRAVLVLDEQNTITHQELVEEIGNEPDYQRALAALDL